MEPADGDPPPPPPFWPQPPTGYYNRRRISPPSLFLNTTLLIILVPITVLFLLFFILPPFLNLSSQIHKPNIATANTVKKSWDSITILLVLFAILGGVFARKDDDGNRGSTSQSISTTTTRQCIRNLNLNPPQHWLDFDQNQFQKIVATPPSIGLGTSSSLNPDLRHGSVSVDDRFSFFDDFELNIYQNLMVNDDSVHPHQRLIDEESEIEVIPVDENESQSPPPPSDRSTVRRTTHRAVRKEKTEVKRPKIPPKYPTSDVSSPPPPPPPSESERPNVSRSTQKTYRSVPRADKLEVKRHGTPPSASAPPSPPPLPGKVAARSAELQVKIERKKSNATKELKSVLASIYNQRKRKKTQKTKIIIDDSLNSQSSGTDLGFRQPQPPPPPSPLPPPPSVFNNLFKQSSETKIVHPPPPPPPPVYRSSKFQSKIPRPSKPTSENSGCPPLPRFIHNYYDRDEISNISGRSSSIPSPPPPPFQMSEKKFSVSGGYVREDIDLSNKIEKDGMDGGDLIGSSSVCCPSPDVNIKAEDFIARLRGEWKLAKNDSLKAKQALGHGPGLC